MGEISIKDIIKLRRLAEGTKKFYSHITKYLYWDFFLTKIFVFHQNEVLYYLMVAPVYEGVRISGKDWWQWSNMLHETILYFKQKNCRWQ